jgi:hypothetical protein
MKRSGLLFGAVALAVALNVLGVASNAFAVPVLQIYIEGATYDNFTETWVTNADSFKLWVAGNVGLKGAIDNVKLSAAVATGESGTISLTPTTTSLLTDPSTPVAPVYNGLSADGARPVMGDGSLLPPHGIFGAGTSFHEWSLGNFTLTDSPLGDFSVSYPATFPDSGQINAYTVAVTGYSLVHFDAYDHYTTLKNGPHGTEVLFHYVNAPFSHDGEANPPAVPEPTTMLLLGSGLVGLGVWRRIRR